MQIKTRLSKLCRLTLRLCISAVIFFSVTNAQTIAPGGPGKDAQWLNAGKQAIGTSASLESKVWFTLADGVMTEVLYPNVGTANVQMLQFIVVDPKAKKVETERDDAMHEIKVLRSDSLTFQQVNSARSGEWSITKTYAASNVFSSILIDVRFESKKKDLNLYVYFDPSIANSGMHDSAFSVNNTLVAMEDGKSAALSFSSKIDEVSSGFVGISDGLQDLRDYGHIVNRSKRANNGNVAQIAKIVQPNNFTVVLTFASDSKLLGGLGRVHSDMAALLNGQTVKRKGFTKTLADYEKGWADYINTLPRVDPKYQTQFNMAAMVLKALEDKTTRGANIASPTVPWGGGSNANEGGNGYRMIWSRDLYHVFTAYLLTGDRAAATRALDFLFNIQQKPDGSFPQNSYLDGQKGWGSLQMDEVGYPLIMAWQLGRFDKQTYEKHVKPAADFIVRTGPATPQERWEEEGGYSPSTIAAEIAGLVCAAEIARKNGDNTSAELYLKTADDWQANIEKWTVTKTGKYDDGNYYLRITANGRPDAGDKIELNNGSGTFDEREIVDAGFLDLVRLGIKRADDPLIVKSVKVIDELLKSDNPNGAAFYRYNHDGYGEEFDGRKWNWNGKYEGKGHPWPLLAGERGEYEIARCGSGPSATPGGFTSRKEACLATAKSRLDAMLAFANEGMMIPEQVWDKKEIPTGYDRDFVPELKFGEGTGSATPLAWSMAQFIRLALNLKAGRNLETPQIVYDRYILGKR